MSLPISPRAGPADFRLRTATNADTDAIRRLIHSVLEEHGLQPDPGGTDSDLDDIEASYHRQGGRFDVLVDRQGEIVGTVGLLPEGSGQAELRKMYLRADCRGLGLGRLLLARALAAAREIRCHRVTLETATVLRAAIRLYELHGFRRVDRGAHAGRCDLVMELELD